MTSKFAMLPPAAIIDLRLSASSIRVLALLADRGGNKIKGCWPSYTTLAKLLGLTKRSIQSHISELVKYGYLEREKQVRGDGSHTSNLYRVKFDISIEISSDDDAKDDAENSGGVGEKKQHIGGEEICTPNKNHTKEEPDRINQTKKIYKKAKLVSLANWENVNGLLAPEMVKDWCKEKQLSRQVVNQMISEFRTEMVSKAKQYADFRAAFQVYLIKGYLSKTLQTCQNLSKQTIAGTVVNNRGVNL